MNITDYKPTERFSKAANYYHKYRPGYPAEIVVFLKDNIGLNPSSIIADIGSGTGILSELFLKNGNTVYAVEPNMEMHKESVKNFLNYKKFYPVYGQAEMTGLDSDSIDVITAGQAFHWFEPAGTSLEFGRILKTGGYVVLIWNKRSNDDEFSIKYEALLKNYCVEYNRVNHSLIDYKYIKNTFSINDIYEQVFPNQQIMNYDMLSGRLLSCSYAPDSNNPDFKEFFDRLRKLYDEYNENDMIIFKYKTYVYYFQLT